MTATVDILTQTKKNIVIAPISAIIVKKRSEIDANTPQDQADKRQEAVFVVQDGKALLRAVDTGIQDNTNIEIISGLAKDEQLIIAPYEAITKQLKNNDPVQLNTNKNK